MLYCNLERFDAKVWRARDKRQFDNWILDFQSNLSPMEKTTKFQNQLFNNAVSASRWKTTIAGRKQKQHQKGKNFTLKQNIQRTLCSNIGKMTFKRQPMIKFAMRKLFSMPVLKSPKLLPPSNHGGWSHRFLSNHLKFRHKNSIFGTFLIRKKTEKRKIILWFTLLRIHPSRPKECVKFKNEASSRF